MSRAPRSRAPSREDRRLAAHAQALRRGVLADARRLESCVDDDLAQLGVRRHPFTALALATTTGALLGAWGSKHGGAALARGGRAALSALSWARLLG